MKFELMQIIALVLTAIQAYLLGSISTAIILSKTIKKDDVRNHGSHNAGMTNSLRVYGKKIAALTFVGDLLKGAIAVVLGRLIVKYIGGFGEKEIIIGACVAGLFVIIGHIFPVYFGFKGGKGVLTSLGMFLFIDPIPALIAFSIFLIVVAISKYVSLGSVVSMVCFPFVEYFFNVSRGDNPWVLTVFGVIVAGISVFMHRANIKRLINGTESKIGQKAK